MACRGRIDSPVDSHTLVYRRGAIGAEARLFDVARAAVSCDWNDGAWRVACNPHGHPPGSPITSWPHTPPVRGGVSPMKNSFPRRDLLKGSTALAAVTVFAEPARPAAPEPTPITPALIEAARKEGTVA